MIATEREISNIFEWLKTTKHVFVNVDWLGACISWLKSRGRTQRNFDMVSKCAYCNIRAFQIELCVVSFGEWCFMYNY